MDEFVCILLVVLMSFTNVSGYNVFDCSHSPPWELDYDDDGAATMSLQNYINAHQYDCNPARTVQQVTSANFGIGSALYLSLLDMIKTFEYNALYRPIGDWPWCDKKIHSMHSPPSWNVPTRHFIDCCFFL